MRSRTSCFNGALLRKNLTRFAPLWGLYTLCLLLGGVLIYGDGGTFYWFARNLGQVTTEQVMPLVNLFYAPIVAMLLFGDLYNSRMCSAIHAMPMRRETVYCTNVLSGLLFSLIPTAIMALLSLPLLLSSRVVNAWQVAFLWLAASNLQFAVYFGFALLCAQCAGTRYVLGLLYGVLNLWPPTLYALIDELYTPMLYGVITPSGWTEKLSPMYLVNSGSGTYMKFETPYEARLRLGLPDAHLDTIDTHFEIMPEGWQILAGWAAVGVVLAVLALLLYRRRHLERAGDAVAFRMLEPVLLVLSAITGGFLGCFGMSAFFGYRLETMRWLLLAAGLAVGWFAGKMIIARSTRVFRPRNWLGLAILTAVFASSLAMTYFDVFRIDDYIPEKDDIAAAKVGLYSRDGMLTLTDGEDIDSLLRLHALALEDRVTGSFHSEENYPAFLTPVTVQDKEGGEEFQELIFGRYAGELALTYTLKDGRQVKRSYFVWSDEEEGDIARSFLSRWEVVRRNYVNYDYDGFLEELGRSPVRYLQIGCLEEDQSIPEELYDAEEMLSLLKAVELDCAEGTMTQSRHYHECYFLRSDGSYTSSFFFNIGVEYSDFSITVYADARHTIQWFRDRGLLTWTTHEGAAIAQ